MNNTILKIKNRILMAVCISGLVLSFYGCGQSGDDTDSAADNGNSATEDGTDSEGSGYKSTGNDYEDYIHNALEAVKDSAKVDTGDESSDTAVPDTDAADSTGRVIQIEREDSDSSEPESVFVSGTEASDTNNTDSSVFDSSSSDGTGSDGSTAASDSSSSTAAPKTTPDTFDVGTGFVYIDGKYDTTYSKDLLKIIQDARTGLNYPTVNSNTSLETCAKLRSKEITCYLSHYRLDGSMYYSLAPDYYKAEIITIDGATAQQTFDAWLEDPVSRGIIFSKDYQSVGVADYVCNGLNCIVVSFGY